MSWNDRPSFGEGLAKLKDYAAQGPARTDRPPLASREEIRTAHSVFQPRLFSEDLGDDEAHVQELVRAIKARPRNDPFLDPILVIAIREDFICVDGMHRLLAYKRAGIEGPVPVEHFEGSIDDAVAEAMRRNSRDKLPMTNNDKLEAAWRLVVLGVHSKPQVIDATGVSHGTVDNMRSVLRRLRERGKGDDFTPPETWRGAREALNGHERRDFSDEQRQAQIREWSRRLAKSFGKKVGGQADVFAEALEMYSSRLPRKLVEHWIDYAREVVEEGENADF